MVHIYEAIKVIKHFLNYKFHTFYVNRFWDKRYIDRNTIVDINKCTFYHKDDIYRLPRLKITQIRSLNDK